MKQTYEQKFRIHSYFLKNIVFSGVCIGENVTGTAYRLLNGYIKMVWPKRSQQVAYLLFAAIIFSAVMMHNANASMYFNTQYKVQNIAREKYPGILIYNFIGATFYNRSLGNRNDKVSLQKWKAIKNEINFLGKGIVKTNMHSLYDVEDSINDQSQIYLSSRWEYFTYSIFIIVVLLFICLCLYFLYALKYIVKRNKGLHKIQVDLELAKDQAEYASKVKSQFLSVVSHEIRTPLNAIVGVSNLLQTESDETQQENISVLRSSTQLLLRLINDLLDLHKLELGKMESDSEPLDLRAISYSLINMFKVSALQRGIELKFVFDENIYIDLLGDDIKLTQALTNLVSNAIKFTDKGFVELRVEQTGRAEQTSKIRFTVKDTGIGIHEKEQKNIFESFVQANKNTSRIYGGSGLGLSISKRLIEVLGGEIKLVSKPNQGSAFSFELEFMHHIPIVNKDEIEYYGEHKIIGKRILIVEDNPVNILVIKQFLEQKGVNLGVTHNGQEAIELLKNEQFDLILMDVQMPVKNGLETTAEIRMSDYKWKDIPIIALTASHEDEMRDDIVKSGMNDYVIKPFEPKDLVQKLSKQFSIS